METNTNKIFSEYSSLRCKHLTIYSIIIKALGETSPLTAAVPLVVEALCSQSLHTVHVDTYLLVTRLNHSCPRIQPTTE